jgi:hypothetical protein
MNTLPNIFMHTKKIEITKSINIIYLQHYQDD